jgi:hypothetical protein
MSHLLTEVPNSILSPKLGSSELGQFQIASNFHFMELLYIMWHVAIARIGSTSVVTVMTNVFQNNGIMVSRKLAKIMRIFVDTGHIKNRGVIYWPKKIGLVIPMLWSGHIFSQNSRLKT